MVSKKILEKINRLVRTNKKKKDSLKILSLWDDGTSFNSGNNLLLLLGCDSEKPVEGESSVEREYPKTFILEKAVNRFNKGQTKECSGIALVLCAYGGNEPFYADAVKIKDYL